MYHEDCKIESHRDVIDCLIEDVNLSSQVRNSLTELAVMISMRNDMDKLKLWFETKWE